MRLTSLQSSSPCFVLALAVHVLVLPGHPARAVPRDGREQPSARLPLPAPRGVLFDRNGKVLVENRSPSTSRSSASRPTESRSDAPRAGRRRPAPTRRLRETVNRRSPRAELSADRADRERDAGAGGGVAAALDFELPDIIVSRCRRGSTRPSELAAHLFGYVGEATEAQLARRDAASSPAPSSARPASSRRTTQLLMGTDGARTRRSSTASAARSGRWTRGRADRGPAAAADDRLRRPEGGRGRFHARSGSTARRSCSIPGPAKSCRSSACRRTTRTRLPSGIDRATWYVAQHRRASARCRTARIQGRYSPGSTFKMAVGDRGARGGHRHARLQGPLLRRRDVLRPLLQVPSQRRTRHRRHAARDREVLQRLLLHARQHARRRSHRTSGRRCSASASKSGIDLPNEIDGHRAVHRVEAAAHGARNGTRARRFRWRSARARCR